MRRSVIWFVLLSVIAALIALSMRQPGGGGVKLEDPDFPALIGKIGFLVLVGGAVMTLFRDRFVQALQWALLWVVIGLALVVGYTYRFELRDTASRVMAELMPGYAVTRAGGVVELRRSRSGDFQVHARINGAPVAMVLDTGASAVVLTHEAAQAAGLPTEFIRYNVNVDTANGRAQAAAVTLDRIAVGSIIERGVPALIAPPGQLKTSLLGMSFLNRLEGWEVRNGRLMMRARPET
ncbi:MAG: TIGR02281 family clan AA aspartic protease [Xanthobacteraceae bacterium]